MTSRPSYGGEYHHASIVIIIMILDSSRKPRLTCLISHLHWGHTGNPSKFPNSVKLIVGPGVTESSMPGWPEVATAEFKEADIANHEVVQISEDQFTSEIGGMRAYDYFGDGSFYLLSAPGVSIGRSTRYSPD